MLFLTMISTVYFLLFFFESIFFIILLALKLFFFFFLFFNLSTNTFLLYINYFYCNIVFSPFFLFWLLIFFVSFQFLFFSPQKLTYFTMIMLGHHTAGPSSRSQSRSLWPGLPRKEPRLDGLRGPGPGWNWLMSGG